MHLTSADALQPSDTVTLQFAEKLPLGLDIVRLTAGLPNSEMRTKN